jgi:Spy/CpxP family protein refolding chaperone
MKQTILPTLLLAAALAGAGISHATEHQRHEGMQHGKMGGEMCKRMGGGGMMMHGMHSYAHMVTLHADALKLTDEQLGKLTRLHLQQMKTHQEIMHKLHKSMMDFHQESMKPAADENTLRNFGKDHANAFSEMVEQGIKARGEVNAILTTEQQAQLKAMKMDHEKGMMDMMMGKVEPRPQGEKKP